jgi:hypothetical protein
MTEAEEKTTLEDAWGDFKDSRTPPLGGLSHVCSAYCQARIANHSGAEFHWAEARKAGFPPSVLARNNRAYSFIQLKKLDQAEWELQAINDPAGRALPAVRYNRAVLALRRRYGRDKVPVAEEALEDVRAVLGGQAGDRDLYFVAAQLFAFAAEDATRVPTPAPRRAFLTEQAFDNLRRALRAGLDPEVLKNGPAHEAFRGHPDFGTLSQVVPEGPLPPLLPLRLLDPTPDVLPE